MRSLPAPAFDLYTLFEEDFEPATFERGMTYARQGRATVESVQATSENGLLISGHCRGSAGKTYEVAVWLDADPADGQLFVSDTDCSCPVGIDCKHAAALLLTFAEQAAREEGAAPAAEEGVGTEARQWLAALDDTADERTSLKGAGSEAETNRRDRLVYLLHPGHPPLLSLGKSHPLKKGGMSRPARVALQTYDLSPHSRRPFIGSADEAPLRLFSALQSHPHSYLMTSEVRLTGEIGALLLEQALRTGRLYLDEDLAHPLTALPERALQLRWQENSRGKQQLAFDLPGHMQVLSTWPLHVLDPAERGIARLKSELPEQLLRTLMSAPPLNEHEAVLVRAKLEDYGQRHALRLPVPAAQAIQDAAAPPRARLLLTRARVRHEALYSLEEEYPAAELRFDYAEGVSVTGSAQPDPLVRFERDGSPVTLRRDLAHERACWARLEAAGLLGFRQRLPAYRRIGSTEDCLLTAPADARGWLPLMSERLTGLEAAGIDIEYAPDFPFQLASADEWFVALDEAEDGGQDWFDLDLGVVIDGERVSLVPPLLQLMRDQPQLLQRLDTLDETATLPLQLDQRRLLPVPVARLRSWLRPLLEFLDDDRPRLSRYQAAALADLEEQPTRWLGGEALRELGERLRNFAGIAEAQPAPGFAATLRPYQQAGLNWLQFLRSYQLSGVLADDMGLGKTVQTLAHLHLEKAAGRADRPSLVVAPTSLLPNWAAEARQFAPGLKVLTLHGPTRDRHYESMNEADLILTTYALLVRDRDVLLARDYHLLVLDEAQFIKNPKAQSHQVARRLQARHRLSLTGTPLENHLGELWAQFDFLMPGLLGDARRFTETFRSPIEKQGDREAHRRLSARVAPFLLRRTKEQVLTELPPRTEIVRWVELGGAQRDLYESLRVAFDKKLREVLAAQGVGRSQIMILDALLKLRQVCCDPRLVKLDSARKLTAKGAAESAKLEELMGLLEELIDEGRRILLFSQFTSMLGLIETELKKRRFGYAKLTGQTRDRETPVREFQAGKVPIFMISLKAGGTGLNLTAADTVIHYDPWWNPAVEAQATARAHRIGQDKPVFVYKLLGRGTVEEKILALQDRKRGLADQLLGERKDAEGSHLLTAADLDVLFEPLG